MSLNIYEYDAVGRLVRVIARSADGRDRTAESHEYDPAGHKEKTIYVDVINHRPDTHYTWGVEGTDSGYSAPGAATLKTLYNDREQPTHLLFYDATDRLLSRIEFSYDADANLIEEAQTNTADMLPPEMLTAMNAAQLEVVGAMLAGVGEPVRRTHRYDRHGRRIESHSRIGLLGGAIKTMAYNQHGDQIAEAFQHEAREYGIDDKGQLSDTPIKESINRSDARFQYDYDASANWVLKTIKSRVTEDQPFTKCHVEQRTIEYFTTSRDVGT